MSSISWTNTAGGLWGGPNWSGNVPTLSDAVTISAAGTYTVTIAAATAAAAGSLVVNDAGATVDDLGTLTIGTALSIQAGTFILDNGGTLSGGTISVTAATGTLALAGGTLSAVKILGALNLSAAAADATIANGISLTGTAGTGAGTINLTGAGADLFYLGNGTLTNATLNLGNSTTADTLSVLDTGSGGILTLGSTLSTKLTTGTATLTDAGGLGDGIVNNGTLSVAGTSKAYSLTIAGNSFTNAASAAVSGGALKITDTNFANTGTIAVSGTSGKGAVAGTLTVGGATGTNGGLISLATAGTIQLSSTNFTNTGTINVSAGTVEFGGTALSETEAQTDSWSSSGTIIDSGATLLLNGAFSTASLNTITHTKGTMEIVGTDNNVGAVLNVGAGSALGTITCGSFTTTTVGTDTIYNTYGYIVGGTIHDAGGGFLANYGTLDGVIYQGTLSITGSDTDLSIVDGITLQNLSGTGPGAMQIGLSKYNTYVGIYGSTTLDNATITMGSNSTTATSHGTTTVTAVGSYMYITDTAAHPTGTLTLGTNLILTENSVAHLVSVTDGGNAGDALINNGTVIAQAATGYMDLGGYEMVNNGSMAVSNGGTLEIDSYSQFINTGTITSTNGTLLIDVNATGKTPPAGTVEVQTELTNLGTIIATGGDVEFCGTLTAGWNTNFSGTGGQTYIQGYTYAQDAGTTLVIGPGTAGVANQLVLGGTIIGGAINDLGGGLIAEGGTLDGVTYQGNLDPGVKTGYTDHYIDITDGITLTGANGTGPGTVTLTSGVNLLGLGSNTLDNAAITIGATTGSVILGEDLASHGTFTLGAGAVLTESGTSATLQSGTGATDSFTNLGVINGTAAGSLLITGNNFTNDGSLNTGADLVDTALTTTNAGTISGSGLIGGTLTNSGLIIASGGVLTLAGADSGGGTLEFGTGGSFVLDQAANDLTGVAGMVAGNTLDLAGLAGATAQISGGELVISPAAGSPFSYALDSSVTGLTVATQSDGAGGTDVYFVNLASGGLASTTVSLGNVHVGDVAGGALSISNTAPGGVYTENLDASILGAMGGASGSGSFTGLGAGLTDSTDLSVALNTATAGAITGGVTVGYYSDGSGVDGNGAVYVGSQTVQVTGTVYAYAAPEVAATVDIGAARVGDSLTGSFSLGDGTSASAYQESLVYTLTGIGSGSGTILSGASAELGVSLDTSGSGDISGFGTLGLVSTGAGTDGLADTSLGTTVVTVTGEVYQAAVAQLAETSFNFGIVHVGDTVSTGVGISNIASGSLVDQLLASFISSGAFSSSGSLDLAAGGSGSLTVGFDTSAAGMFSGNLALALASHDTVLADLMLASLYVNFTGTVDNYAQASLGSAGGSASYTSAGVNGAVNFGTTYFGSSASETISVTNAAVGQADLLSGSLSVLGSSAGFSNSGLGSFTGLTAGQAFAGLDITLTGTLSGTYTETIVLTAAGYNASGYYGALGSETLTVTDTVVGTYALTAGADSIAAGNGTDIITATAGTLSKGDSINGGGGSNTLVLSGAGAFSLAAPGTFLNIGTVSAQELTTGEQAITLRAGTTLTVNVASLAGGSISIVGANNSDTINLGNGSDSVTLGSFNETVYGGSGTDIFNVTATTIKAAIHAGSGSDTLSVSGGGTVKMGSNLTGTFADVVLAGSGYSFTADTQAGLAITASGTTDTITVGAASQTVTGTGAATIVHVDASAANAGLLISNVGTGSVLEVTTGGTVTLNSALTGVTVELDKAAHLTLSSMSFVTAIGSSGNDVITAESTGQTLTGGLGTDSLIGYAGFGDTFSDTIAGLNSDKITNFGGNDVIDITNLTGTVSHSILTHSGNTVLDLTGSSGSLSITLLGSFNSADFTFTSGTNGTVIGYTGH